MVAGFKDKMRLDLRNNACVDFEGLSPAAAASTAAEEEDAPAGVPAAAAEVRLLSRSLSLSCCSSCSSRVS